MSSSPFDMKDRNFIEIRNRINRHEEEIGMLMLERELSVAASDLLAMTGWKNLCSRVKALGERQIARLKSEEMQPYWLGRAQGYLRAMDTIIALRSMSPEELALIEDRVTLCMEKVTDLRNLLDE